VRYAGEITIQMKCPDSDSVFAHPMLVFPGKILPCIFLEQSSSLSIIIQEVVAFPSDPPQ
jgi:hypothetical protein